MGDNTYFYVWAEELVDEIVTSICDVITEEGGDDPVYSFLLNLPVARICGSIIPGHFIK